jgi:hypothetical protein
MHTTRKPHGFTNGAWPRLGLPPQCVAFFIALLEHTVAKTILIYIAKSMASGHTVTKVTLDTSVALVTPLIALLMSQPVT